MNRFSKTVKGIEFTKLHWYSHSPVDFIFTKSFPDFIHRLVEMNDFLTVFKQIDLMTAADKMAKTDSYQSNQQSSIEEFVEEFFYYIN